jgi:hypothetical protein
VVRVQAIGVSPTHLVAKFWKEADGEPAGWDLDESETNPVMQVAGYPSFRFNVGVGVPNLPVTFGIAGWKYLRVPTGRVHPAGSEVVLIEDWPLPPYAVTGEGPPLNAPASAVAYLDTQPRPAWQYVRVGSDWWGSPLDGAPPFVSTAKWGTD